MNEERTGVYITAEERRAFAWLWDGYLRRFTPSIAMLSLLVIVHSASVVGFLALINNNFSALFDPNNGTFTFVDEAQRTHERGQYADNNADGIYEFEIEVKSDAQKQGDWVTVFISLSPSPDSSLIGEGALVFESDGVQALSKENIAQIVGSNSLGSIAGPDSLFVRFDRSGAGALLLGLLFILFAATLVRVLTSYVSVRLAARITALASFEIRRDLVKQLFSLDLAYFDKAKSGQIVLILNSLVGQIQTFFSGQIVNAGKAVGLIIGMLAYLAYLHPVLFLFIALVFPPAFYGIRAVTGRMRKYMTTGLEVNANFLTNLETSVGGIRTVKLTNQSPRAEQGLIDDAQEMSQIQLRLAKYQALIVPMVDLLAALAVMGVVGLGGFAVIQGWAGLTAGTLVTFVIGLALIFSPAAVLSGFNVTVSKTLVALRTLFELVQERPGIVDIEGATDSFDATGPIEFENLSFSYGAPADQPLFRDLSLRFPGGKTAAIVGQTGSGKTTVLSLISRLYEPSKGAVKIGGTNIRDIKISALRDAFSVVTQDIFLFDGTIEENIKFVAPGATDRQISLAAEKAQLTNLIQDKRSATIGPRGAQLSGGQKQRIAIARAFLQDAPIVLLDEATSALDQRTEEKITLAMRDLCKGKTTLIIAHRLTTITHADEIFVLEKGMIAERGTHKELMKDGGLYAALYRAQQGDQREEP